MNVVLIRPRLHGSGYEPPLGILYIASYIRKYSDATVKVIDAEASNLSKNDVKSELKKIKPNLVGISVLSYDRFQGFEIADISKKLGAFVVIGGPHVTFTDKETLKNVSSIDVVVRGEGENTMLELLNNLKSNESLDDIKGITFRKNGQITSRNPDRELIADINLIPPPAWDLVPMEKYQYHAVFASRGCPYNCIFCASPRIWKRKLRIRDPSDVIDEIEYLLNKYGKKVVHIKDDTFTANKKFIHNFCDELKKRNLSFNWECMGRVNTIDEEILQRLKDNNCQLIEIGVETGNEQIMRIINKQITKKQVIYAVNLCKKMGIDVGTFFMLGHPGDNEKNIEETFNFALQLRSDFCTFNPTDIFPGTELYNIAKEKNYLPDDFSWSKKIYNINGNPVPRFENPELPELKLVEYSKRFYMRYAFCRLFDIKDKRDLKYLFVNEYTPYHLTPKSKQDFKLLYDEFIYGLKKSSAIIQKIKGFIILPAFITRYGINGFKRLMLLKIK